MDQLHAENDPRDAGDDGQNGTPSGRSNGRTDRLPIPGRHLALAFVLGSLAWSGAILLVVWLVGRA